MNFKEFFTRLTRHLQGERRGMGSELKPPTPEQEALAAALYPDLFMGPSIVIQTLVQLADVSFWQGVIDFIKMKASGLAGVIIRAGQNTWEDTKFKINWALAKAAGLARGSYFFYDSRVDPSRQAELWWNLIKGDTGELVHVADFEENYGGAFGKVEHFKAFLQRFQELSGLPNDRIAIYTGFYWWIERVGPDSWFARYQLWLASYGSMSAARIPVPWSAINLHFWQYTASGDGPGHGVSSQEIDLNWYCCDLVAYNKRFPLATGEIPPPQGEPMTDYLFSITPTEANGCKVRPEPDTGNSAFTIALPFGKLAYGNERKTIAEDRFENGVQVNRAGDIWLKVEEVNGVKLSEPGYIAEIHLGRRWATIAQINQPPPTEPQPDELVITQTFASPGYVSQTVTTILKPAE
jgi:lysozyme